MVTIHRILCFARRCGLITTSGHSNLATYRIAAVARVRVHCSTKAPVAAVRSLSTNERSLRCKLSAQSVFYITRQSLSLSKNVSSRGDLGFHDKWFLGLTRLCPQSAHDWFGHYCRAQHTLTDHTQTTSRQTSAATDRIYARPYVPATRTSNANASGSLLFMCNSPLVHLMKADSAPDGRQPSDQTNRLQMLLRL